MDAFPARVARAYERIRPHILETPLVRSDWYSRVSGSEVYFKCENLQHTRAFKIRGALNKVLSLDPRELTGRTLVTASGGNHGLAVAHAARLLGLKSLVYLPTSTPQHKIEAIKAMGGAVAIHGNAWDEANEEAIKTGRREGFLYIHAFDDERVIEGQGTIALEILRQIKRPDLVMTSIGGGGLISGIASYLKTVDAGIRVAGVETAGADSMSRSIRAGALVTLPAITSKAESLGAKRVSTRTFEAARTHVDAFHVVTDSEAEAEQAVIRREEGFLVELASSCTVAGFRRYEAEAMRGRRVVILLCGGNAAE
jgi:threonine dehydratase